MQMQLLARHTVGMNHLFGRDAISSGTLSQLADASRTASDNLRVAVIAAELSGAAAAQERLGRLSPDEELSADREILRRIYAGSVQEITATDRQRLIRRHGWFGRLALSFGLGSDDPARLAVLRPAMRTAMALTAAGVAVILGLLAGVALLVTAAVLASQGMLRRSYRPPPRGEGLLLESFALYLAWFVGISLLGAGMAGEGGVRWLWMVLAGAAPLACLWPRLRGLGGAELRHALGWHRGRGVWREVAAGLIGYIAGLPIVAVGLAISSFLARETGVQPSHPIVDAVSTDAWRIMGLLTLASVYAPLAEETMFRGSLYGGIRRPWGLVLATAGVAFVFAIVHPQGWVALPALGAIAVVLSAQREWRGSLIAPVVSHAVNNGILVILLVMLVG